MSAKTAQFSAANFNIVEYRFQNFSINTTEKNEKYLWGKNDFKTFEFFIVEELETNLMSLVMFITLNICSTCFEH